MPLFCCVGWRLLWTRDRQTSLHERAVTHSPSSSSAGASACLIPTSLFPVPCSARTRAAHERDGRRQRFKAQPFFTHRQKSLDYRNAILLVPSFTHSSSLSAFRVPISRSVGCCCCCCSRCFCCCPVLLSACTRSRRLGRKV